MGQADEQELQVVGRAGREADQFGSRLRQADCILQAPALDPHKCCGWAVHSYCLAIPGPHLLAIYDDEGRLLMLLTHLRYNPGSISHLQRQNSGASVEQGSSMCIRTCCAPQEGRQPR